MKLKSVEIENYRAIEHLSLTLDPSLTVLHGDNGYGKTSVLSAIAVGLGSEEILGPFLDTFIDFCEGDWREDPGEPRVLLTDMNGEPWERQGTRSVVEREKREQSVVVRSGISGEDIGTIGRTSAHSPSASSHNSRKGGYEGCPHSQCR